MCTIRIKPTPRVSFIFVFCAAFFFFGALFGAFGKDLPTARGFENGFAHAFPLVFTAEAFFRALLFQFLPPLLLAFSGFCLAEKQFSALVISFRAFLCGYLIFSAQRVFDVGGARLLFYLFFCLAELLTLVSYFGMEGLAARFLVLARRKTERNAVLLYCFDQLFFIGLILLLYLLRGTAVLLLAR